MSETPRIERDHDERLSSLYRATAPEAPPPALDDAIRAAARRAVAARPQRAGALFARRWQTPLSIAAVLVLCVSLVVLMRDEGGELMQAPRADAPATVAAGREAAVNASAVPKIELAPEASRAGNIGLKPPQSLPHAPASDADQYALATPAAPVGIRGSAGASPPEPARRSSALPQKTERSAGELADAAVGQREGKLAQREAAAAAESPQAAIATDARSRIASGQVAAPAASAASAIAESVPAPRQGAADRMERDSARAQARPNVPAAPPASRAEAVTQAKKAAAEPQAAFEKSAKESADAVALMTRLPPDKWLERIDELRRQGRLNEARAGLAEFRKRYPDYALPAALRDWAQQ